LQLRKYEAMFLFDPSVTPDWEAVQAEMRRLLERANARIITLNKWDERRLAYEIRGRKRAIYALTYFEAPTDRIHELERDARLSEAVLRSMVLDASYLTEEQMKEIASRPADYSAMEAERIGGRMGGGGGGGGGRDRGGDRRPPARREESEPAGSETVKAEE
jgi:small subunit ribosomal protein S6